MSDYTHCPDCNTPTKEAYGIGPYCPNKECSRIDDLRPNTMIAGAGFAMMAAVLAWHRAYGSWAVDTYDDLPRGIPTPRGIGSHDSASAEYYRILDRATRKWQSALPAMRRGFSETAIL